MDKGAEQADAIGPRCRSAVDPRRSVGVGA